MRRRVTLNYASADHKDQGEALGLIKMCDAAVLVAKRLPVALLMHGFHLVLK